MYDLLYRSLSGIWSVRIGSIEGTFDSLYRSVTMYGCAALLATSCERKIAGPADPYFDR